MSDFNEHAKPTDFTVGDAVELHPGLDLWMRGARYGTVQAIGREKVHVRLDRGSMITLIEPSRLSIIER